MTRLQWTSFEKKIYIKSSVEELYQLWSTKRGICSWFLKDAVYTSKDGKQRKEDDVIQSGDRYTWRWHNWDGQEDGTVLNVNGHDKLHFTFADSQLEVKLIQQNDVVIVHLKQFEIPTDEESLLKIHVGCSNGWTFWLTNLKVYLEYGILLNEKEIDLRSHDLSEYVFVNM